MGGNNAVRNSKSFNMPFSSWMGKGQNMGPGRGQNMDDRRGQSSGRHSTSTAKGYHVLPVKSGRGAKLPVVPGTVPANTGTFGRLFSGKSDNVGGYNNPPAATRSAMGNRGGNSVGMWRSGVQSRSLDADYYMDGQGGPGNPRSQLETVVEAGRGVRKLPAQPGGVNTLPMQNQGNLSIGQRGASNMVPHQPPASSNNMQTGVGMGGPNQPMQSGVNMGQTPNRFGIAGTAVTALHCMQPGAPNGSAVNVVHNPRGMQMDNGYGHQDNMMDMGGGNQFQTEVQVMPSQQQQQQQQTQHPSVQFAQPEWT